MLMSDDCTAFSDLKSYYMYFDSGDQLSRLVIGCKVETVEREELT